MPGARCRVLENGALLNKESPYADGEGGVTVQIRTTTRTLRLEWAPADVPEGPRYPYRRIYHVILGPTVERGVERRLGNIGFLAYSTLEDNVKDFQRAYFETSDPSGEPHDVDTTLTLFHDLGTLPPLGTKVPDTGSKGSSFAPSGQKQKNAPPGDKPAPAPAPAPRGAAAATLRPALRVQIIRAFALEKGTLHAPKKTSPEALSDPDAILDELYPSEALLTYRFPKSPDHAVKKANLSVFFGKTSKGVVQTDDKGIAVVDLKGAPPSSTLRIVVIPPDENDLVANPPARPPAVRKLQINPTNAAAGPDMTTSSTALVYMYRVFVLEVDLDAAGLVPLDAKGDPDTSKIRVRSARAPAVDAGGDIPATSVTVTAAAKPPYVKLIRARVSKGQAGDTPEIEIDWRTDWIKGKQQPRHAPWNQFLVRRSALASPPAPAPAPPVPPLTAGAPPPAIVLHQTHTTSLFFGVIDGFLRGSRGTSIHYVVDLDGHAIKMTDEHFIGNHAGRGQWYDKNAVNFFSVGIENVHSDVSPPGTDPGKYTPRDFPQEQYDGIMRLCKELMLAFSIKPKDVLGHRDGNLLGQKVKDGQGRDIPYPATRYTSRAHGGKPDCPGMFFQWELFEKAGIAIPPSETPSPAILGDDDGEDATLAINAYRSPPDALNDQEKPHVQKVLPKDYPKQSVADVLLILKRCLYDIGYSVSDADPFPGRSTLTGNLDGGLIGAIQNFQTHHFSAARRAYRHEFRTIKTPERTETLKGRPKIGHIDADTIRAVIEAWWGKNAAP